MFDVNYIAIFVAAIIGMAVGALWYSPVLFGRQWMVLMGFTPENMAKAKEKMWRSYLLGFISLLVTAFVLTNIAVVWGSYGFVGGMQIGFWVWLGFFATTILGSVLWENKTWKLYFINVFQWLVVLLLMGGILSAWV